MEHDYSVITDKMAETAVNMFEPFIKDPTILGKGKYSPKIIKHNALCQYYILIKWRLHHLNTRKDIYCQ